MGFFLALPTPIPYATQTKVQLQKSTFSVQLESAPPKKSAPTFCFAGSHLQGSPSSLAVALAFIIFRKTSLCCPLMLRELRTQSAFFFFFFFFKTVTCSQIYMKLYFKRSLSVTSGFLLLLWPPPREPTSQLFCFLKRDKDSPQPPIAGFLLTFH